MDAKERSECGLVDIVEWMCQEQMELLAHVEDSIRNGNFKMMKQTEKRQIALRAARAQLRTLGIDPQKTASFQDILAVLDDLARSEPDLVASQWYTASTNHQIAALRRDWHAWLREQRNR